MIAMEYAIVRLQRGESRHLMSQPDRLQLTIDYFMPSHSHAFPDWPFDSPVNAISYCTAKVVKGQSPIRQVSHDKDGDWQFLDATTDEPEECMILCMGCVFERDPSLQEIADLPVGWAAFRQDKGEPWERWENPEDEEDAIDG